ncbi:MAG: hypothetical protein LBP59_19845 [Planctomycetaceae bacterium]|jgi:hypothetical protein|nr:hypothetical protein [Planctomycetaceae bacterium]
MRKIIIVTFLFTIFLTGKIFAMDFVDGKITVMELQQYDVTNTSTRHGYAEYKFLIKNSDTSPHKIKISLTPSIRVDDNGLVFSTDAIEVAAGGNAILRLFQPPVRFYSGMLDVNVSIDGWSQNKDFKITCNHMSASFGSASSSNVMICFSQQVPVTIRDFFTRRSTLSLQEEAKKTAAAKATTLPSPSPSSYSPSPPSSPSLPVKQNQSVYSTVPVDEWSESWVSYTRFDCVVMTGVEWDGLIVRKPMVLGAIKRYVEAGGMLIILGKDWESPQEWKPVINVAANDKSDIERAIVCGKLFVIGRTSEEIAANAPFFDQIIKQIDDAANTALLRLNLAQNENSFSRRGMMFGGSSESHISRMHNILPVVKEYGVNIKLVLVLIILFAILIGPVNVFVLRSLNKRIWLIWTVPATSLIASFIVLLASFLSEGLLRQSSSITCTALDQRRGTATTFGFIGYYSTFSTGNLNFTPDIELLPFLDTSAGTLELRVNRSGNQTLFGGWILPRVPAYFALRKNLVQQKLNVTFNWTDEKKPTATNGLGVKINHLLVCSPNGEFFETNNIDAGEQKILVRTATPKSKMTEAGFYTNLRTIQNELLTSGNNSITTQLELFPNSYSASISDWNPFVEQCIPNTKQFSHKTTILGIYE